MFDEFGAQQTLLREARQRVAGAGTYAMRLHGLHHLGERGCRRPITVQCLECLAIVRSHTHLETRHAEVRIVDHAAHLEARNLTCEHTELDTRLGTGFDDHRLELEVMLRHRWRSLLRPHLHLHLLLPHAFPARNASSRSSRRRRWRSSIRRRSSLVTSTPSS